MNTIWKVKAIREWAAVAKGMEVEIAIQNRTGKPYVKEIAQALTKKYGIKDLSSSGMSESIFEFIKN
jgi:hypothetical protein